MNIETWQFIAFILMVIVGIVTVVYTFQQCGLSALLLGNGSFYAAATGMCD